MNFQEVNQLAFKKEKVSKLEAEIILLLILWVREDEVTNLTSRNSILSKLQLKLSSICQKKGTLLTHLKSLHVESGYSQGNRRRKCHLAGNDVFQGVGKRF